MIAHNRTAGVFDPLQESAQYNGVRGNDTTMMMVMVVIMMVVMMIAMMMMMIFVKLET